MSCRRVVLLATVALGLASCNAPHATDILDKLSTPERESLRGLSTVDLAKFRVSMAGWLKCADHYQQADPDADAKAAVLKGERRPYSAVSNGEAVFEYVPGIKACSRDVDPSLARPIGNPAPGDGPHYGVEDACDSATVSYATRYNQTLAAIDPPLTACTPVRR